ncbi:hypothetical protein L207DRAFT_181341 [Hyaloscypha variabilis F]|uniref:Uncharacterized protein n=1 Tax=Hyaloscypha variabilis (strain UAMH 11265 / GT02V1 / F) TaxID=1149755 RepID=A0A2J6R1P9_HYAVF|nr:hypothetical protein L207DRAFT_181341 [Hyaloscypha variabilis F]
MIQEAQSIGGAEALRNWIGIFEMLRATGGVERSWLVTREDEGLVPQPVREFIDLWVSVYHNILVGELACMYLAATGLLQAPRGLCEAGRAENQSEATPEIIQTLRTLSLEVSDTIDEWETPAPLLAYETTIEKYGDTIIVEDQNNDQLAA